jgi:protein involved in polysaccharide export with SLBB domain
VNKISLILVFLIFCFAVVSAQEQTQLFDMQNAKYETSLQKYYQQRAVTQTIVTQVLEDELEAADYIIGPGDRLEVNIFGELEDKLEFTVLPEGNVLIPTIGDLKISGLSLEEAKELILAEVKKYYIKAKISVNLIGLRKFRIYLTGEVKNPGAYFVQGSDRLSDVLDISGGTTPKTTIAAGLNDWADDTKIEIRHKDDTVDKIDITRFYRLGDKSSNPYLRGGDIIFAPSIKLTDPYVIIEGNVGNQGIYSLKDNETLITFLRRVCALSKRSNLESIILIRDGKRQKLDILNEQEKHENFTLKNRDKIMIPTIYDKVYVRGEVYTPGAFPYLANYLSKDYIGLAGALDSGVDEDKIIVVRQTSGEVLKGPNIIIEKGDTIILPKRGREVFKDYMTIIAPIISMLIATLALVTK